MTTTLDRLKSHTSWQSINDALEAVDCAEAALKSCKIRVAEMIRLSYMERGVPIGSDGMIDKSNLSKLIRGDTWSRPAVERYIEHLQSQSHS